MTGPHLARLGRRKRWAGAAVGVGGLLLVASLIMPWFVVQSAGTINREGFFLMFWTSAPPAVTGIAQATLGVSAALAGACSALGWRVPRPVHIVLSLMLLGAFLHVAWVLARLAQLPHESGVEELVGPSWGLLFALAGPLMGAAGSLALAFAKRPSPDSSA